MGFLFVGERPSPTAARKGLTWRDGRLAAKQLFDALVTLGIDPAEHRFDNIFRPDPVGPEVVCKNALRRVRYAYLRGWKVVAMGKKVEKALAGWVEYTPIVHPAARGRIRKKARYAKHVRLALTY